MNFWHRFWRYEDLSPDGNESYLLRWTLLSLFGWKVYLHKILATDWAREPHDHPKDFISIGLKGRYVEEVYSATKEYSFLGYDLLIPTELKLTELIKFDAPWIRRFPAEHIHRLRVAEDEHAWTICIVNRARRPWGFYKEDGAFVTYLDFMRERG